MHVFGRVPGWLWGIVVTLVIVGALVAYSTVTGSRDAKEPAVTTTTSSGKIQASQDPTPVQEMKSALNQTIHDYVQAFLSREPSMTTDDYLERMRPYATAEHLESFERQINTPIEQRYIQDGLTIEVIILNKIDGHIDDDGKLLRFEGVVPVRLVLIQDDDRSVLAKRLVYELYMVKDDEDTWHAEFFAPAS